MSRNERGPAPAQESRPAPTDVREPTSYYRQECRSGRPAVCLRHACPGAPSPPLKHSGIQGPPLAVLAPCGNPVMPILLDSCACLMGLCMHDGLHVVERAPSCRAHGDDSVSRIAAAHLASVVVLRTRPNAHLCELNRQHLALEERIAAWHARPMLAGT